MRGERLAVGGVPDTSPLEAIGIALSGPLGMDEKTSDIGHLVRAARRVVPESKGASYDLPLAMGTKVRAALQTYHAIKASDLAAAFNDALKRVRIMPGDYVPQLTEPSGPSTAGGVQAMQHIRLVPSQPGQPTIVVGNANQAEQRAELRTYEYLDAVHQQRFKQDLTLDRSQYEDFVRLAKQILEALHLKTTLSAAPLDLETPAPAASNWKLVCGFAIALVLLGLGLWRALNKG